MKKSMVLFGAILAAVFLSAGCGGDSSSTGNNTTPQDPSFATDIQPILSSRCATSGCHDGANSTGTGLIMTLGSAYANLVNVNSTEVPSLKRVLPGDAANSYLVDKIEGTAAVGDRMPLTGAALTATQIKTIRNWINQGAENN